MNKIKMMKYINNFMLVLVFLPFLCGCQDLADTLKDYTGDGEIRYVGKCTDMVVSPGWKHLTVDWTNSVDPIVRHVMVKWESESLSDSVVLNAGTHEYDIKDLNDGSYRVSVMGMDKGGSKSEEVFTYARPYTENHEAVLAFTQVVSKHFFIGNRLALGFSDWQNSVISAILKYTKSNGDTTSLNIDSKLVGKGYYLLPDAIDPARPVTLYRKGFLTGCADTITFAPVVLTDVPVFNSDFKEFIRRTYGTGSEQMTADGEIRTEWAKSVTTLELDGNFTSFNDILYMPNLKKLVLGKHRYLTEEGAKDTKRGRYAVYDTKGSAFALKTLKSLNGLETDRYASHYYNFSLNDYYKNMGLSPLPELSTIPLTKAMLEVSPADAAGYNSNIANLIDGKSNTFWEPAESSEEQTYTIDIDLGQMKSVAGLFLVQRTFDASDQDTEDLPSSIQVDVAGEDGEYQSATNVVEIGLGRTTGETNIVPFKYGLGKVRFVRLRIPSQFVRSFYRVTLAEIGLYQ